MIELTQEYLKSTLHYDPRTGHFTWIKARQKVVIGKRAGCFDSYGYIRIMIDGRLLMAHRLAWLYIYGEWPDDHLDHKNQIRHDNRILNLRECSRSQNMGNQRKHTNNTSGYKGVSWHKGAKKWHAQICKDSKRNHLGYFDNKDVAANAYNKKALELFGEFAHLNDIPYYDLTLD